MRQFFEGNNPYALEEIEIRLLETAKRGSGMLTLRCSMGSRIHISRWRV
ncbi:MAG: hypothetical protein U9N36_05400 [Euryarchaeota archaeon]|nr:hypothetical protein [Euryarchaeota archaeon]